MKKPVAKKPVHGIPVPKAITHHHHHKPVHVTRAVKVARHSAAVKAAKTRAANAKKAKQHPRRQLALGDGVACCSAEALAASLRLAGWPAGDEDVLALYWRTAADADAGASILATLEAACEFGLAGVRPLGVAGVTSVLGAVIGSPALPADGRVVEDHAIPLAHALILGVDLPGPHSVLATPDGWWSWGELYDPAAFPDAVIEEAWEVTW